GRDFLRPGPGWGGSCFDGAETVLVRTPEGVRLVRFDEVADLVDRAGEYGLEALAWAPDQPRPEFRRITQITERPYEGEMVDVRTKMGRRLAVTADHPFV